MTICYFCDSEYHEVICDDCNSEVCHCQTIVGTCFVCIEEGISSQMFTFARRYSNNMFMKNQELFFKKYKQMLDHLHYRYTIRELYVKHSIRVLVKNWWERISEPENEDSQSGHVLWNIIE